MFPIHANSEEHSHYKDEDEVRKLLKSSQKDYIHESSKYHQLLCEFKTMIRHADKRLNEVIFYKCLNTNCCNPYASKKVQDYLVHWSFKLPDPVPDPIHEGHFQTFLSRNECEADSKPDAHHPVFQDRGLGRCEHCPSWTFTSEAEKKSHNRMFHHGSKTYSTKRSRRTYRCKKCKSVFPAKKQYNQHMQSKHEKKTQKASKK